MPEEEPENQHNISTYHFSSLKERQRKLAKNENFFWPISDALVKVADGLVSKCKDFQVIGKVDRKNGVQLEGTKVRSGGIEIPLIYFLQMTG